MATILGKIAGFVVMLAATVGIVSAPTANLGGALPGQDGLLDTYLAAGISSTDTSMTLANGSLRDGTSLTGYECFTVDSGQPTTEYICGTASSTSVTSLIRGIKVSNPNATSSALAYSHRRFASVQITDFPFNQLVQRKLNGTDQFDTKLQYSFTSTSTLTDGGDIPNKAYVDAQATAGCANADTSTKGCVELATAAEAAAGTAVGGSGANLVPANSLFNATTSATRIAPITKSNGKLSQAFLDLTEAFTITGTTTISNAGSITVSTATSTATSTDAFNLLPAGVIQMYASSTSPLGWLLANGTSYATSTYPRLFNVIGYVYGGSTSTFSVPDMRGRFVTGPSSTISTTIGAIGGSLTATGTASVAPRDGIGNCIASGSPCTGSGGPGYTFSNSAAISTGTSTVTATPPYIIQSFIIKY